MGLLEGKNEAESKEAHRCHETCLLVGSPMCTKFSSWRRISRVRGEDPSLIRAERDEAVSHFAFVCHLYAKQAAARRLFLHEHPAQAEL